MKVRTKIAISLMILITLIISLFGGVYFYHINSLLIEDRYNVLESLSVNTGENVKKLLSRGYQDVQLLSQNPVLKSNISTDIEKLETLNMVEETYGIYDDISLIDLDGNIIASTSYIFDGVWKEKEWFQNAKNGNITITNAHMISNPREVIVEYLSPIKDNAGQIISVISIRFPLIHLWTDIESINISHEGFIFILNSFNMYISHPNKELVLTAPSEYIPFEEMNQNIGIIEYSDKDNKEMIGGYCTLFETEDYKQEGWKVVVVQPKEEIMNIINQSNLFFYMIIALSSVVITLISFWLTKTIVKPIKKLKEQTKKIGKGELDTKIHLSSNDEFSDLAKSFNNMTTDLKKLKAHLEKHIKQKDEFITQLGHDLKTPLVPLVTLTPILKHHTDGKSDTLEMIEVIEKSTNRIKNMVDKTLQLAKLNSQYITFEITEMNLHNNIKNAIKFNQFLFNENNIEVINKVDEELLVQSDKKQLYEIFKNLFTNAVKYSKDNKGCIIINSKLGDDNEIIISVKDDGIGISSEQQEFVFDEFFKTDESRHDLNSSGLGLSIIKRIVEYQGGRIWVESEGLGKGSTFYFTLKVNRKKEG